MFNNIGAKIKGLAKFIFWVLSIISILFGCYTIIMGVKDVVDGSNSGISSIIYGVVIAIGGVIVAWLENFLLYGFGELVDSNQKILKELERRNIQ